MMVHMRQQRSGGPTCWLLMVNFHPRGLPPPQRTWKVPIESVARLKAFDCFRPASHQQRHGSRKATRIEYWQAYGPRLLWEGVLCEQHHTVALPLLYKDELGEKCLLPHGRWTAATLTLLGVEMCLFEGLKPQLE